MKTKFIIIANGINKTLEEELPRTTEIDRDYQEVTFTFPNNSLEMTIERKKRGRSFKSNSFKKLSLEGQIDGRLVVLKNLRCKEFKTVYYQAE